MPELRYTVLGEGSSDQALIPILDWLLAQHLINCAVQSAWAELRRLPDPPRTLPERIAKCIDIYPCELLFVHRDADRAGYVAWLAEVRGSTEAAAPLSAATVPVIPVRMLEAWLLADHQALRRAAGNPNGRQPLDLPPLNRLEGLADPKAVLRACFMEASGLTGHRRRKLRVSTTDIARLTDDFAMLRRLPAFRALEAEIADALARLGWSR